MEEDQIDFKTKANLAFDNIVHKYSSKVVSNRDLSGLSRNLKLYSDFVLELYRKTADIADDINIDNDANKDEIRKIVMVKMRKALVEMRALIRI